MLCGRMPGTIQPRVMASRRVRRVFAPLGFHKWKEEEEEAVFISVVNTNEDPPNAHEEEEEAVLTRESITQRHQCSIKLQVYYAHKLTRTRWHTAGSKIGSKRCVHTVSLSVDALVQHARYT